MTSGEDFAAIYRRELGRLSDEIAAYPDEASLWRTIGTQQNAPGNLALHLTGNLLAYIGAGLGETGYVRDRDFEFEGRRSREEILVQIHHAADVVSRVLAGITEDAMEATYPGEPPARLVGIRTRPFLQHLLWHLGWHLGQIYYHRLALEEGAA